MIGGYMDFTKLLHYFILSSGCSNEGIFNHRLKYVECLE